MFELEQDVVVDRVDELEDRLAVRFKEHAAIYRLAREIDGFEDAKALLEQAAGSGATVRVTLVSNRIEAVAGADG